jgi:cysteine-rich repeat protein
MTRERIARPVATGLPAGQLAGLAAVFALAGIGCSPAAVDKGGGSGGTAGGTGATGNPGSSGASGSASGGINLHPSTGTGGTTTANSTKVCNATSTSGCKAQIPEACGDGINNQNGIEQCDDGNVLPGDGCNGVCKVEPNWNCPPAGACTRKVVCGDGVIGPGEVCDDANTLDGDGCNSTCTVQDPAYHGERSQLHQRLPSAGRVR